MSNLDPIRLAEIANAALDPGSHANMSKGMCVMEAVSYVSGEPWSDAPECACPVISAFMRVWNYVLPDDKRTALLQPMIPLLVGSRATSEVEDRRSLMAADWLVRECTPAWLRLAGLTAQADALAGLPEITDMAQIPSIRPAIEAARKASADADAAARSAVDAAAAAATWTAAMDAVRAAVRAAVRDAADAAVRAAVRAAASAAVRDANRGKAAAMAAAMDKLTPTIEQLQASSLALVKRMIEVRA